MALILCIETATAICSVAVVDGKNVLAIKETDQKNAHSAVLNIFIRDILLQSGLTFQSLNAIAVSKGPGSYTGLRIGVSTAKGLCYALDLPLIAIDTLFSMAGGFSHHHMDLPENALLCPMIDARRMEVYTALFDRELNEIQPVSAQIITNESFEGFLEQHPVYFFGDGAEKCQKVFSSQPKAHFISSFTNSAAHMAYLADTKFRDSAFENLAYFEPFYLKDFIAAKSRVKGLFE